MVSVIVPVYKSEKTLTRCVESLLAQDYADVEILLIVDGPPDGSGILAEQLAKKDARIRVINQKNQGVSHARNRGIAEARGEYIRFVDSDDYVTEHAISSMVNCIEKEKSDLVIAGYHHLYFGDCITKLPHRNGSFKVRKQPEPLCRLYADGFLNMPWNKLYRRNRIVEGFPEDISLGEDLIFNMQYIGKAEKVSLLQETVCEYVQDDRGTTLSTKKRDDRITTALTLYQASFDFFKTLFPEKTRFPFLEEKVVTTFLDEVQELGFAEGSKKEKYDTTATYADALHRFLAGRECGEKERVRLHKLDYKIVFFFLRRNMLHTTQLLVWLRMRVVRVVRKGRR